MKENICPKIVDYDESLIWKIESKLSDEKSLILLVGLNNEIICDYVLDKRAAPGIKNFDEINCIGE